MVSASKRHLIYFGVKVKEKILIIIIVSDKKSSFRFA